MSLPRSIEFCVSTLKLRRLGAPAGGLYGLPQSTAFPGPSPIITLTHSSPRVNLILVSFLHLPTHIIIAMKTYGLRAPLKRRPILLISSLCFCPLAAAQPSTSSSNPSSTHLVSTTSPARLPSEDTAPGIIRPSEGEILTGGQQYTIQWSPPTEPGEVAIELWQHGVAPYPLHDAGDRCDGWIVNSQCDKIVDHIVDATSYGETQVSVTRFPCGSNLL